MRIIDPSVSGPLHARPYNKGIKVKSTGEGGLDYQILGQRLYFCA
jgi:hypothetical protein